MYEFTLKRDHVFTTVHATAHRKIDENPTVLKAGKVLRLGTRPEKVSRDTGLLFGRHYVSVEGSEDADLNSGRWILQFRPKDWEDLEIYELAGKDSGISLAPEDIKRIKKEQKAFYG